MPALFDLCCLLCLKYGVEVEEKEGECVDMSDGTNQHILLPVDVEEKLQDNIVQVRGPLFIYLFLLFYYFIFYYFIFYYYSFIFIPIFTVCLV